MALRNVEKALTPMSFHLVSALLGPAPTFVWLPFHAVVPSFLGCRIFGRFSSKPDVTLGS